MIIDIDPDVVDYTPLDFATRFLVLTPGRWNAMLCAHTYEVWILTTADGFFKYNTRQFFHISTSVSKKCAIVSRCVP